MLNYHPDKPQYSETKHDNFLTDPQWLKGVALLEKYNLSLELHVLPRQMQRSAAVVQKFPGIMFMVDHCGLPYERDEETMKLWRDGMWLVTVIDCYVDNNQHHSLCLNINIRSCAVLGNQ